MKLLNLHPLGTVYQKLSYQVSQPLKSLILMLSGLVLLAPVLAVLPVSATPTINEYPIPVSNEEPNAIATGPDGALWFGESGPGGSGGEIGRITTSGTFTEYAVPNAERIGPMTTGPDGNLWFGFGSDVYNGIPNNYGGVAQITPSGNVTEYVLPTPGLSVDGITAGPDGALWFTEEEPGTEMIGRITTSGSITQYPIPEVNPEPVAITAGPDGALWFTEYEQNSSTSSIGRITTSGNITQYPLPSSSGAPNSIVAGPDGNLWFTEISGNPVIGSITTSGDITQYPLPTGSDAVTITRGPDSNLWFTDIGTNSIGQITTSGDVSEYPVTQNGSSPQTITSGPDGNLWFTDNGNNSIGQVVIASAPSAPTNLTSPSPTTAPVLTWDAVSGATSYNIYRNGVNIGTTTNTTYTDNSLTSDGTYSYTVTAVNTSGESSQSSPVSVIYDTTPPVVTITGVINGETYAANNTPTPVCTTTDSLSGVATDAYLTISNSGNAYTATCSGAEDNAGNVSALVSVSYTLLPVNYTLVNLSDSNGNALSNAKVTIENTASQITTLHTDSFGNTYLNTAPGTYKVTVYYANGYVSQSITVTSNGPNNLTFSTVPVTVTINDPNSQDIANASVAQAGNTGTFGPTVPVNSSGQVVFQVLPGTSTFTAFDAYGYEKQSITASATNNTLTFNTYSVQVTVTKNGNPLTTATVKHAGNTGSYSSGYNLDNNGQVTIYVLPGSNYFTAYDGPNYYTKETLNVTGNTSTTIAVN